LNFSVLPERIRIRVTARLISRPERRVLRGKPGTSGICRFCRATESFGKFLKKERVRSSKSALAVIASFNSFLTRLRIFPLKMDGAINKTTINISIVIQVIFKNFFKRILFLMNEKQFYIEP